MPRASDEPGTVAVPADTHRAGAAIRHVADEYPDAALVMLLTRHPAQFTVETGADEICDEEWRRWLEDARDETRSLVAGALDGDRRRTDVRCWSAAGRRTELILKATRDDAVDRLVVGDRPCGRAYRLLVGSPVERIARRAGCRVTVLD